MIEIAAQLRPDYTLKPFSQEDLEKLKTYSPNQILQIKAWGTRKARSLNQNRWVHAMFRFVAANTEDPEWDTDVKVKRNVKMAMKFFKDDVIVYKNKVYFELRSFAFDQMEQNEANVRYEEAKNLCAKKIGVDPATLEAEAQRE